MFSFNSVANFANALVSGDKGVIANMVEKKLESMGEDLIGEALGDVVGGSSSIAGRLANAVVTGGQSEIDALGHEFLNQLKPSPVPGIGALRKAERAFHFMEGTGRRLPIGQRDYHARPGSWRASSWATSRQDWLDNHWRHDWRSQPRDLHGRWIPGRLDYINQQLQYRGKSHKGREHRAKMRKLRQLRKRVSRDELRRMMAGTRNRRGREDGN